MAEELAAAHAPTMRNISAVAHTHEKRQLRYLHRSGEGVVVSCYCAMCSPLVLHRAGALYPLCVRSERMATQKCSHLLDHFVLSGIREKMPARYSSGF